MSIEQDLKTEAAAALQLLENGKTIGRMAARREAVTLLSLADIQIGMALGYLAGAPRHPCVDLATNALATLRDEIASYLSPTDETQQAAE